MSLISRTLLPALTAMAIIIHASGCAGKEAENEDKPAGGEKTAAVESQAPAAVNASLNHAMTFQVKGMTCQGCVNSVTTAINELAGVEKCEVTLEPGSAVVIADESIEDDIIAAVTNAGYTIERAESTETDAGGGEPDSADSTTAG